MKPKVSKKNELVFLHYINADGNLDIVGVGNSYASDPLAGYYDAGIGICLLGNGIGSFHALNVLRSGFFVDTDAKGLVVLESALHTPLWLVTANQDSLKVFEQQTISGPLLFPEAHDAFAEFELYTGKKQKKELYYGAGYLSQSTRGFPIPAGVRAVYLTNDKGIRRKVWEGKQILSSN